MCRQDPDPDGTDIQLLGGRPPGLPPFQFYNTDKKGFEILKYGLY
jgi:hypothetical protein